MFKAGGKIALKGKSIRNVKGILVAPSIEINGLVISADKSIPKEISNFFAKHKMEVQQIVEDGDKLVRLTGEFTLRREALAEIEGMHKLSVAKPAETPKSPTVATSSAAPHDAEVEIIDLVIGGIDADVKVRADVALVDPTAERKQAVALHFQRQLEVSTQMKRILHNMQSAIGPTFTNPLMRGAVSLGPKAVLTNQPGKDLQLPDSMLKPGTDVQKVGRFGFINALVFTDLSQKIIIRVPRELVLEGEFTSLLNTKIGYLTEVSSGDLYSISGKTATIKNCLIRVKDSVIIESQEDIHIEMDQTVIWGNKTEASSLTASYQAFQACASELLNKQNARADASASPAVSESSHVVGEVAARAASK